MKASIAIGVGIVALCSLAALAVINLSGCAATEVALEHKDLKVSSEMSATIFLDVENRTSKTVYLDIRNTSDKEFELRPLIVARLAGQGYTVTDNAKEACYILQMNVLSVGTADPSALHQSLYAGWGGALAGGLAGTAAGYNKAGYWNSYNNSNKYAAIGVLIGGTAELVAGSLVKNVTYAVITDLQVLEHSDEPVQQTASSNLQQGDATHVLQTANSVQARKKYQTRIISTANKVNLKFEAALPLLANKLAKSVAGIFGS